MLFEADGIKAGGGESWIPVCLPGFDNKGYLYMYVSFLELTESNVCETGDDEHVAKEGAVAISVLDNGTGFRPEEKAGAGNAFRRFDRKGAQTGAGLGLAIAVALARRTGGALNLASPPGRGTRTELRLPRAS